MRHIPIALLLAALAFALSGCAGRVVQPPELPTITLGAPTQGCDQECLNQFRQAVVVIAGKLDQIGNMLAQHAQEVHERHSNIARVGGR